MTDVVGRGTIELVGDARKLQASIAEAKKSIRTLGEGQRDISKSASQSIDNYIGRLQAQNAAIGKTRTETELYKLALRGASNEQINAAQAALVLQESHIRNVAILDKATVGLMAIASAAAVAGGAFAAMLNSTINTADHLKDLSKSTDIGVETLAGLSLLAKQTGTDLDGLAKGINKMSVEMGKSPDAFRALGITAKDSIGAFKQFADIFNLLPDIQQRNALAQKVFNKSWAEMAPALSEGGKKIGEIIEKGARLSGITKEIADRADEFKDRVAELNLALDATKFKLVGDMLPGLTSIAEAMREAAQESGFLAAAWVALGGVAANMFKTSDVARLKQVQEDITKWQAKIVDMAGRQNTSGAQSILNNLIAEEARLANLIAAKVVPPPASPKNKSGADAAAAAARAAAFLREPGSAAEEAKAQLALDLAQIKKASESTIGIFINAEKIMEARRAANLVDDKAYFASKLGFITLNSQEQEAELQKEIERLQKETFAGKDAAKNRLDNQKQIAEAQAKLTKVRNDAVANVEINGIQEAAANTKLAQSYVDARIAADAYIESVLRRNKAEIEGIGRGSQFREVQAGRNQIEDKLIAERQRIERDRRNNPQIAAKVFDDYLKVAEDTYAAEVAAYEERTKAIRSKEADWTNGAREAFQNYIDQSRNIAKQTEELFTNAFKGMEDALVSFVKTGKLDFKSLADSIISNLIRIQIQQQVTGPLSNLASSFLKNIFGGGGGISAAEDAALQSAAGFAVGGTFSAGQTMMVGERGPELVTFNRPGTVIPNDQMGGGGVNVSINNIIDARGSDPSVMPRMEALMAQQKRDIVPMVVDAFRRGGAARSYMKG